MTPDSAVILAAGRGARLGALTRDRPKPMLEVAGRPMLAHILDGLALAGVRRAVIVTGWQGQAIRRHFGDGSSSGMAIEYREQEALNGTGGAALAARDVFSRPAFLTFGDILLHPPGHYAQAAALYAGRQPDAVLAANWTPDPCIGGAVYFDNDLRITRMVEKPAPGASTTNYNQAGLFVFGPAIVQALEAAGYSERGEIELTAGVAGMLAAGRTVLAYTVPQADWLDIGTPEALRHAEETLRKGGDSGDD